MERDGERRDVDRSVLSILEDRGQKPPRVQLKGATPGPATGERYERLGEIARGEVGVLLKGRDADLGRDVALKVLLDGHLENAERVRRFVEEAQIAGQLQHPGVVPVYELGAEADGKPFFAMKLVKGHTLAALLSERADPADDQRRFLGIFLEICQTMAYAHSRGVVHRDLKPANVMIGRFGEVQVVDWGLAKVLRQGGLEDEKRAREITKISVRSEHESDSRIGSVFGTVAFMPPEQALGYMDDLDERADVFALGAILTEVLTGEPPYTGENGGLLNEAANARTEAAFARLDESGADSELVSLAKTCLAASRGDRPRDATPLARAVSDHLAAVEERAHRFAVEAAEAKAESEKAEREAAEQRAEAEAARRRTAEVRARTEEQRRSRRQTLALAASVALFLLVGAGGLLWFVGERRSRTEAAASRVTAAIEEARRHQGEGIWESAFAAAANARALAESEDTDKKTRSRVRALAADLEQAKQEADAEAARVAKDDAMLDRIDSAFLSRAVQWDIESLDAEMVRAYRDYGIDVVELTEAEAAKRIRESRISERLATSLDHWAGFRRLVGEWQKGADWRRLLRIAGLADPDLAHQSLRRALLAGDQDQIDQFAATANLEDLPLSIVRLLGVILFRNPKLQLEFLRRAHVRYPEDLDLTISLATSLQSQDPPLTEEAARCCTAALALAPERAGIWTAYGIAVSMLSQADEAIAAFRRAIELEPEFPWSYTMLSGALRATGKAEEADEVLRRQVIVLEKRLSEVPDDSRSRFALATACSMLGEIDRVIAAVGAGDSKRDRARRQIMLGYAEWARGDRSAAILHYRAAIQEGLEVDLAGVYVQLGVAHLESGEFSQARKSFERAEATLQHAKAGTEAARKLEELSARLPEIVRGDLLPKDPEETLLFARLCFYTRNYRASARFYEELLAGPEVESPIFFGNTYQAACAAALAAGRRGKDAAGLAAEEAGRLRAKALEWLDLLLDESHSMLIGATLRPGLAFSLTVPTWYVVRRDLGDLRAEAELEIRTEEERAGWRKFWQHLETRVPRLR